ncbi:MAG: redox-sensing transcriptional repressor Rex [Gemmataceae bacterium]
MAKRREHLSREPHLSRAAALRLSLYLRCLRGEETVSSGQLAAAVGVSDAQVRRDLAALGHLGRRGIGYDAVELIEVIRKKLGIDRTWRAVIVGVGNLARALLRYRGFREHGFEVVGLFDADPAKIGTTFEGLTVEPVERLASRVAILKAEMGVLTVPAEAAQSAAEMLCDGGIRGLLTFAPAILKVPASVRVVPVDLTIQFEQLAFWVRSGDPTNRVRSRS